MHISCCHDSKWLAHPIEKFQRGVESFLEVKFYVRFTFCSSKAPIGKNKEFCVFY